MAKKVRKTAEISFPDIATQDGPHTQRSNFIRDALNATQLHVGGSVYTISFRHRLWERFQVLGQTDFFNDTMLFDANLTPALLLQTVIHELLEAINRKYHLNLDHSLINALESHIFDALIANPHLLEVLLQYARKLRK